MKRFNATSQKVIISGNTIETYQYEYPIVFNTSSKGGRRRKLDHPSDKQYEHRRAAINRAIINFKRLLACNFPNTYKFVTLTFSNECNFDITNIDACKHEFNKFKKRLQNYLRRHFQTADPFKYIGVTEFQDRNRHTVHYHLITNLPHIPRNELNRIWRNGNTWIKTSHSTIKSNKKITR